MWTADKLRYEKKYLSNMILKLIGENQQLLRENRLFRREIGSLNNPQTYVKTMLEDMLIQDEIKRQKDMRNQHMQYQQEELHNCQFLRHLDDLKRKVEQERVASFEWQPCDSAQDSDSVRCHHLSSLEMARPCLDYEFSRNNKLRNNQLLRHLECQRRNVEQERGASFEWQPYDSARVSDSVTCYHLSRPVMDGPCLDYELSRNIKQKKIEERRWKILKEQQHMMETRRALTEQGKHIDCLQTRINELEEEFKNTDLGGTLQAEEFKDDNYGSWIREVDLDHSGTHMNRADKRSYVYVWQKSTNFTSESAIPRSEVCQEMPKQVVPKKLPCDNLKCVPSVESLKCCPAPEKVCEVVDPCKKVTPEVCGICKDSLNNTWLNESLKILKGSEGPGESVLAWLKKSMDHYLEKGPCVSNQNLVKFLEESINSLRDCKISGQDGVKKWIEVSINNLQEEGPQTSKLTVPEWLDASIKSIHNLQRESRELRRSILKMSQASMRSFLGEDIEREEPSFSAGESREKSTLNVAKWLQSSFRKVIDECECEEPHEENVPQFLKKSLETIEEECTEDAREDVKEWLKKSICRLKRYSEQSHQFLDDFLKKSIMCLQDVRPDVCNAQEWLENSMENVQKEASILNVKSWISTRKTSSIASEQSVQEWLDESMKSLNTEIPEASRHDVSAWIETTRMYLEDQGPEASKISLQDWLEVVSESLKGKSPDKSVTDVQEWLGDVVEKVQEEGSRQKVLEWLEESFRSLKEENPRFSKQDVKDWLADSLMNVSDISHVATTQDVKDWINETISDVDVKQRPESQSHDIQKFLSRSILRLKKKGGSSGRSLTWLDDAQSSPRAQRSPKESVSKIQRAVSRLSIYAKRCRLQKQKLQESLLSDLWFVINWYRKHPKEFFQAILPFASPIAGMVLLWKYCISYCYAAVGFKPY